MSNSEWFIRLNDDVVGPLPDHEVRQLVQQGVVKQNTFVSADGETWFEASKEAALFGQAQPSNPSPAHHEPTAPSPPQYPTQNPQPSAADPAMYVTTEQDGMPVVNTKRRKHGEVTHKQPHRGDLIMWMGFASFLVCLLPCLAGLFGLLGWLLGAGLAITTWVMGQSDLNDIHAGLMNPRGTTKTRLGVTNAILGVGILVVWLVIFILASAASA